MQATMNAQAVVLPVVKAQAPSPTKDEKLDHVLRQLDEAAKNFKSTSADFEYDTYQTDPVPDKDEQKGTIYYEHTGKVFRMAAHVNEHNTKPFSNVYSYTGGIFKLYEGAANQVTTFTKASQFESYLILGFGASGKELEEKWDISYKGSETLDGVKTEKLELIAKDQAVRKTVQKLTVWIDTTRGVSLKQIWDEGGGESRVCVYFNFKVNQSLPESDFTLPTNKQTTYSNR
jgi:outer membrane lipoprotein-sorting protein